MTAKFKHYLFPSKNVALTAINTAIKKAWRENYKDVDFNDDNELELTNIENNEENCITGINGYDYKAGFLVVIYVTDSDGYVEGDEMILSLCLDEQVNAT
jgi:hypothetical protein